MKIEKMAFASRLSRARQLSATTVAATANANSRAFHSSNRLFESVGVVGIPLSKGQRKAGVDRGPKEIRDFGTLKALANRGFNVTGG